MDAALNGMHNHWHVKEAERVDTVTASREGIHVITRKGSGFEKIKLADGAKGKSPNASGAGEVKVGKLKPGKADRHFIATVEPMHGNMLVVYTLGERSPGKPEAGWKRHILTDKLVRGHALWVADFNVDGNDDILVGHSNTKDGKDLPRGLYVFEALTTDGSKWRKHVIDEGGIAVEDAMVADFNGDGKPDIVAGGRYTHNVKLYLNAK
jgi:hypothetical protein